MKTKAEGIVSRPGSPILLENLGSGLVPSVIPPIADKENHPHVAIGGGIEE
jgi:hypothetical protein